MPGKKTYGPINGYDAISILNNQFSQNSFARIDPSINSTAKINIQEYPISNSLLNLAIEVNTPFIFNQSNRYSDSILQGILIDTEAARVLTARHKQFCALSELSELQLDIIQANQAKICFGIGTATSIRSTFVQTPIRNIKIYVID